MAPSHADVPPAVERYGRYYLIERIGRGGMAEVFRAVAQGVEGFRRVFVIKRLRPEKLDSVDLVRMFCDEARLSALLHHPNVVQVYDFGQITGTYFLAMEYLRGKDLAAVMKASRAARTAVSPPIAAYVAQQVAIGLHYAHTLSRMDGRPLGIVHRDVTPSNIMLQRSGAVKILDFGIAQATNFARQTETGGGRVKGKLAYLSPEQVRLEPLDGRSDVFALGVVLWEMLTGRRLFAAENEFLTMRGVLTQPVPAPSSVRLDVPASLDAVVARALQRDRAKRYPDARVMADDLEQVLRETPCHSQALEFLLQHLFGDEAVESTPDLPEPSAAVNGRAPAATAVAPAAAPIIERIAEPTLADGAVTSDTPTPLPGLPPPDRRPVVRAMVAGVSAVTLIACFSWALFHPKQLPHAFVAPSELPALVTAPITARPPAPPQPEPPAAPPVVDEPSPAAALPAPARDAPKVATSRVRAPAKKRAARRLSSSATIDPFK